MSLIMSLIGWPLDIVVGLLGMTPTKRKPEDYFSSRDDLKQKLRDACLLGTNFSKLAEVHDAFTALCVGTADGPSDWTYATFEQLLARDGRTFSNADTDMSLLWRILLAFAAFPFPYKHDQAFTWEAYLHTLALLSRRGRRKLHCPGLALPRKVSHGTPTEHRQRTLQSLMNMMSRSLGSTSPRDRDPIVERCYDIHRDVIDAMAIAMEINDDKFAYYDEDFSTAVAKLQINDMENASSRYIPVEDLERVVKILVACAKSTSSGRETRKYIMQVPTVPHEAIPTASAIMVAIANDAGPGLTQVDLHAAVEVIERELPQAGDALMLYLFELLASIVPGRTVRVSKS